MKTLSPPIPVPLAPKLTAKSGGLVFGFFYGLMVWSLVLALVSSPALWAQGRKDPAYKPNTFDGSPGYAGMLEVLRKYPNQMPSGNSVLVLGTVEKPGKVRYGEGITVSKAIADAGGLARFADSHRIGVWKCRDGWFVPVNLNDVLQKKPGTTDPILEGGDVVIVMERLIGF